MKFRSGVFFLWVSIYGCTAQCSIHLHNCKAKRLCECVADVSGWYLVSICSFSRDLMATVDLKIYHSSLAHYICAYFFTLHSHFTVHHSPSPAESMAFQSFFYSETSSHSITIIYYPKLIYMRCSCTQNSFFWRWNAVSF